MKVLHLLASGGIGGIETLIRNYADYSKNEDIFLFIYNGGTITDELTAMKKEVICVPESVHGNVKRLQWILGVCKELQVDIIISHHSSPIFKLALLCVKIMMPHIRVFAYAHANALFICGTPDKGFNVRKLVHQIGFGVADGVIAISNAVKESLVNELRVKESKIFVLYNSVKLPEPNPTIEAFHEKLELIYVGRLVEEKGVQTIIKAISYGDMRNKLHLTIVGDGEFRESLERLAIESGVQTAIDFVGLQRNIYPYLQSADVFVHTPECEEGFGLTTIEAMAHGLLCICSNKGALPELITDGVNGFIVAAHSPQGLYEKIDWVQKNIEIRCSFVDIRKNAQEYAQQFNFEEYTKRLEEYLMSH